MLIGPTEFLEMAVRERQRDLLTEARRSASARAAASVPRRSWRAAVAAFGRALVGFGRRLESLDSARGRRLPALR